MVAGCGFFNSNLRCPPTTVTRYMPLAISTSLTVPFVPHMWAEPQRTSFTPALETRGNYLRVIGRQRRRVKRGVLVLMDIACYGTRLVGVSVESVSRTRRICVTHGMERHCHSAGQDTQSVGVAMSPQLSLGQKTNWFRECDEVTGVQVGSGRVFP